MLVLVSMVMVVIMAVIVVVVPMVMMMMVMVVVIITAKAEDGLHPRSGSNAQEGEREDQHQADHAGPIQPPERGVIVPV